MDMETICMIKANRQSIFMSADPAAWVATYNLYCGFECPGNVPAIFSDIMASHGPRSFSQPT